MHVPHKLPVILSREEVARLLAAAGNLKHQTALSVAYGAGLRASEVVSLKVSDIDSQRMTLRVEQGKGHKDRYAMLSPVLLERLRAWWKIRPCARQDAQGGWLFPGLNPIDPLDHSSTQPGCPCRCRGGGDRQAGVDAYAEAQLRHPLAGTEGGYPRLSRCCSATRSSKPPALYAQVATEILREVISPIWRPRELS